MIEVFADCSFKHQKKRCAYSVFDTKNRVFYNTRENHKLYTVDSATGELKATLAAVQHIQKLSETGEKDFTVFTDDITNVRILKEKNMLLVDRRPLQYQFIAVYIMTIIDDLKRNGVNITIRFSNRKTHEEMLWVDNMAFYQLRGGARANCKVSIQHNGIK